MTDFSDFELAKIPETEGGVYTLADGVIRDIAEGLEVPIGDEPTTADLQAVMDKVGTNKVLRNNEEVTAFSRDQMVEFVERAGVQRELERSLWTPQVGIFDDDNPLQYKLNVDRFVLMGGVANWQDRMPLLLTDIVRNGAVHILGGNRVMDTATEINNRNVQEIYDAFGRYPTEAEYIASVVAPRFAEEDWTVLATPFETKDGDEMFTKFFEQNSGLLEKKLALGRVANAGIIMAIQMREAARAIDADFDSDPENPQVFVVTDSFPLARTDAEDSEPAYYQKAATALRQTVLAAKKIHETAQTL